MKSGWFRSHVLGTGIGVVISIVVGGVYIVVLEEPGSLFYIVAGVVCVVSPLIGGITAAASIGRKKLTAFVLSGGMTFGVAFMLSVLVYVVYPQFERTSVQLPASCDGFEGGFNPPDHLTYTLSDASTGILIISNAEMAVVAVIDYEHAPYQSTVLLVSTSDKVILQSLPFPDDIISAAMDRDVLYLFNDKLGYLFDSRTGRPIHPFMTIDNYGGLSEWDRPILLGASDGHWYVETTAIFSLWYADGTVVSHRHLTFNAIVRDCFVAGDTHTVTPF
jgi:hypothetical protein